MKIRVLLFAVAMLAAGGGVAWSASSAVPTSFDLTNWTQPDAPAPTADSNCVTNVSGSPPSGTRTCTTPFATPSEQYDAHGDVTANGTLHGTASGHCTSWVTATRINVYQITNGQIGPPSISPDSTREQNEDCSVHFSFSDGSSLDLSANHDEKGPYAVYSARTVQAARGHGTTHGTITYGSGVYRGYVGSLNQSAQYRAVAGLLAQLDGSRQWRANLHKGTTLTAIAYPFPGATVTQDRDPGLRLLSAPKLACSATATSGGKTVKLGTKTAGADGSALIVPKLTSVLQPGKWMIAAVCGTAHAKGTYTISK